MRKVIILLLLALPIAGCVASKQPAYYGNFIPGAINPQQIAEDAVNHLVTLYPPAKTRLKLQHPTQDTFGISLVRLLREKGYAVVEYAAEEQPQQEIDGDPIPLPVSYVLDQAGQSNIYRLTISIGYQTLTRPYLGTDGSFMPIGYWSLKE